MKNRRNRRNRKVFWSIWSCAVHILCYDLLVYDWVPGNNNDDSELVAFKRLMRIDFAKTLHKFWLVLRSYVSFLHMLIAWFKWQTFFLLIWNSCCVISNCFLRCASKNLILNHQYCCQALNSTQFVLRGKKNQIKYLFPLQIDGCLGCSFTTWSRKVNVLVVHWFGNVNVWLNSQSIAITSDPLYAR